MRRTRGAKTPLCDALGATTSSRTKSPRSRPRPAKAPLPSSSKNASHDRFRRDLEALMQHRVVRRAHQNLKRSAEWFRRSPSRSSAGWPSRYVRYGAASALNSLSSHVGKTCSPAGEERRGHKTHDSCSNCLTIATSMDSMPDRPPRSSGSRIQRSFRLNTRDTSEARPTSSGTASDSAEPALLGVRKIDARVSTGGGVGDESLRVVDRGGHQSRMGCPRRHRHRGDYGGLVAWRVALVTTRAEDRRQTAEHLHDRALADEERRQARLAQCYEPPQRVSVA